MRLACILAAWCLTTCGDDRPSDRDAVDVRDGELWVWTNDEHINFRLAKAKLENSSPSLKS